jgi:nickel transport protein
LKGSAKLILFYLLFFPAYLSAHAVFGDIFHCKCFGVKAYYSTGEPMSYALFIVYSPDNKIFQKGRTDKNGKFCFLPDQKGKWNIIVDDGMGHRVTLKNNIEKINNFKKIYFRNNSYNDHLYIKIYFGLSVIFTIFGFLSWIFVFKNGKK